MDGVQAFMAMLMAFFAYLRLRSWLRAGESIEEEQRAIWNTLSKDRKRKQAQKEFEATKSVTAAAINAANMAGIVFVGLMAFTDLLVKTGVGRFFLVALILFFSAVPYTALYYNKDARRAKKYKVFHMGQSGRWLDFSFLATVFACVLIAFPWLCRNIWLSLLYFVFAGISLYVLVRWVFFSRLPGKAKA